MVPISLVEKLKTLLDIISSSSFFYAALVIAVVLLILIFINIKRQQKINNILFTIGWLFVIIVLFIKYHQSIFALGDNFIENIFMAIYFPNLAVYTFVMIVSNASLFYSVFKKDIEIITKIINVISSILIDFLFILILDIIVANNIDIYSKSEVYQNNNLFVLLEITMIIFTLWLLSLLIIKGIKRLLRHGKKNIKIESNDIVNDQVVNKSSFVNYQKPEKVSPKPTIINSNFNYGPTVEANVVPAINNVNVVNHNRVGIDIDKQPPIVDPSSVNMTKPSILNNNINNQVVPDHFINNIYSKDDNRQSIFNNVPTDTVHQLNSNETSLNDTDNDDNIEILL